MRISDWSSDVCSSDLSAGFAREIVRLLSNDGERRRLSERAYARGRTMIWPRAAEAALDQIDAAIAAKPRRLAPARHALTPLAPSLAAVERMSDATGMLQHGIGRATCRESGGQYVEIPVVGVS